MSECLTVFQCLHISVSQGFYVPLSLCSGVCDFHCILWHSICMSLNSCNPVSFCVHFFMCPCVVHPISLCFSVCISPSLSVPDSLPVFCGFYFLSLCVPHDCVSVSSHPCPWRYLNFCISRGSAVCVCLSLWADRSLRLGVWGSNKSLCLSVCASLFSVHPWFFTCPWIFAYSWVLMCPWVIVHPWVCMSLNLYMSLSLSIWTSVCCMSVSGCPWASMLQCLCVFYLRASIPKSLHILEPLWSTGSVSQGLCIPVSGCLWASVLQCLCSWIMCKCLLPCTFCWWVSESVHLWHFALHVCDLAFTVILHLLSPVFANVSVSVSWCCCDSVLSCFVTQYLSFSVPASFSLGPPGCVLVSMHLVSRVPLCICFSYLLALTLLLFWSYSPSLCSCLAACVWCLIDVFLFFWSFHLNSTLLAHRVVLLSGVQYSDSTLPSNASAHHKCTP